MIGFKGTKGKWNACCTEDGHKSHYVFGEGEGTICAMLSNDPNDEGSGFESMEGVITVNERQANAKLIQAAPEMLETLMSLESNNVDMPKPIWNRIQDVIEKVID